MKKYSSIRKERIGNELYVYFQGKLIFKRWIDRDFSAVNHGGEGLTQFARQVVMK